ncbi:alpha-1,2-mannosidase MNL1 [Sugiyamaella lignohabitans]|uniref:alpha-1,2-Mannosidase n=1 Tax=Sugiyamaella lignohabitans TaxID=796027 RepID=A0A167E7G0_9ASCO|nr:alpha-1,2-mannosidase MNL1 [Sugiyamaella lignohabitans]ANB13734.1 alpha-1,2-mannosidase MNL1 [Sugiyamaella lignohabitans]
MRTGLFGLRSSAVVAAVSVVGGIGALGGVEAGEARAVNPSFSNEFSRESLDSLKSEVRDLFYHGWTNYMDIAFPEDELMPLSCSGQSADLDDPMNMGLNDVLGGYSVTLVDSLDMFAIMGDDDLFVQYVADVEKYVSFNVSSTVQVFETTIRGMGGLLSAHLYATIPRLGHRINESEYNGHLLGLAYDLGERLLPAFDTVSGIPHPRVHLQEGVVPLPGQSKLITETCTSGAGSMLLEFSLLSRLTGDPRFEKAARRAFFQLWARRASTNLVGITIDAVSGNWQSVITGVGAGVDSFYEYALKYYVLFGDKSFFEVFETAYEALKKYSFDGWMFHNVNFSTGIYITSWIDALGAFFPGLQVLAGDLTSAIKNHLVYYKLWNTYGGIPERWSTGIHDAIDSVVLEWYPLRPEFIESNYYLYQATKDPFYLQVGASTLRDLQRINKVACGVAGTQDVRTGELSDRMESFFLSETVKYLYVLFDEENILNKEFSNYVYSTEAHPLWYDESVLEYSSVERFPELASKIADNLEVLEIPRYELDLFTTHDESYNDDEDCSIRPSVMFQRIRDIWQNRKREQLASYKIRPVKPEPQCTVWDTTNSGPFLQSSIASWNGFYTLDNFYDYTKPDWITTNHPDRPDAIELVPEFHTNFVDSQSTCRAAVSSQVEILFAVPSGEASKTPYSVGYNHGHPSLKGQHLVVALDLYGKRVRLERKENFVGPNSTFVITAVDDIDVKDVLLVHNLDLSGNDARLIQMVNNTVLFQGFRIENILIDF